MTIYINGEESQFDGSTLADLLEIQSIETTGIAIAVGMEIVSSDRYDSYIIKERDEITIIRATRGG